MAYSPASKLSGFSGGAALSPYDAPTYPADMSAQKAAAEQQHYAKAQCANARDVEPGLRSEADQINDLTGTLVSLAEAIRGHLDPNFGMVGQAQSGSCPAPPAHLRYQLSAAIGNTNHTIEQLRLILDIVSR